MKRRKLPHIHSVIFFVILHFLFTPILCAYDSTRVGTAKDLENTHVREHSRFCSQPTHLSVDLEHQQALKNTVSTHQETDAHSPTVQEASTRSRVFLCRSEI
ncbi:hypothetical protein M758_UG064300 [Ceratodon purpureus]|nr:hypothetical protein M758_UG064300 [Ceratodon purpureus]